MTEYKGADTIDKARFDEDWADFLERYGATDGDMLQGLMIRAAQVAILKKAFKLDDFDVSLDDEGAEQE